MNKFTGKCAIAPRQRSEKTTRVSHRVDSLAGLIQHAHAAYSVEPIGVLEAGDPWTLGVKSIMKLSRNAAQPTPSAKRRPRAIAGRLLA